MISLGPLSPKRYCTYACTFCYVHSSFTRYPTLEVEQIVLWLREHRDKYSIIYISGDTDSFAKPRTEKGLRLLAALADLRCDVLFTTRAPLAQNDVDEIATTSRRLFGQGNLLVACISISRLRSAAHIEPSPVPSPATRIEVLRRLRTAGVPTVLAMRPFLPVIPQEEYIELVNLSKDVADVVLGEAWYFDGNGKLEDMTLGAGLRIDAYSVVNMDFDDNGVAWRMWHSDDLEATVSAHCGKFGIPFFMRSSPAVDYLRERYLPN